MEDTPLEDDNNVSESTEQGPIQVVWQGMTTKPIKLRRKRRKKPFADKDKVIPASIYKDQLTNTSDTTRDFDLAPPTKKAMYISANDTVGKLFSTPGRHIGSPLLAPSYYRNLILKTEVVPEMELDDNGYLCLQPLDSDLTLASTSATVSEECLIEVDKPSTVTKHADTFERLVHGMWKFRKGQPQQRRKRQTATVWTDILVDTQVDNSHGIKQEEVEQEPQNEPPEDQFEHEIFSGELPCQVEFSEEPEGKVLMNGALQDGSVVGCESDNSSNIFETISQKTEQISSTSGNEGMQFKYEEKVVHIANLTTSKLEILSNDPVNTSDQFIGVDIFPNLNPETCTGEAETITPDCPNANVNFSVQQTYGNEQCSEELLGDEIVIRMESDSDMGRQESETADKDGIEENSELRDSNHDKTGLYGDVRSPVIQGPKTNDCDAPSTNPMRDSDRLAKTEVLPDEPVTENYDSDAEIYALDQSPEDFLGDEIVIPMEDLSAVHHDHDPHKYFAEDMDMTQQNDCQDYEHPYTEKVLIEAENENSDTLTGHVDTNGETEECLDEYDVTYIEGESRVSDIVYEIFSADGVLHQIPNEDKDMKPDVIYDETDGGSFTLYDVDIPCSEKSCHNKNITHFSSTKQF